MLSLVVSTLAFFVASHYIKRYLEDLGIEKTFTRGVVVFVLAIFVAYGIAFVIDKLTGS